jgi:hypothetical protein
LPVDPDDPNHPLSSMINPDYHSKVYGVLEIRPKCADCPLGYFQFETDRGECKRCPIGKWTGDSEAQYYCLTTPPPSLSPTPAPTAPTPAPSLSPTGELFELQNSVI